MLISFNITNNYLKKILVISLIKIIDIRVKNKNIRHIIYIKLITTWFCDVGTRQKAAEQSSSRILSHPNNNFIISRFYLVPSQNDGESNRMARRWKWTCHIPTGLPFRVADRGIHFYYYHILINYYLLAYIRCLRSRAFLWFGL